MTIHVAEQTVFVPLDQLTLSPLNVRKRKTTPEQDAELKATILAKGLQQNLVVVPTDETGHFAVVAGGRRLKALQELADEGRIASDFGVRSIVVPVEEGAEHSLIENAVRANMHPSEEVIAFRDLILAQDWSFDAVAERYGVSLRVVNQRMKLANLHPTILNAWRDGGLTQSQVEAFALSDDPERQRAYFEESADWALKPESIRKAMLEKALAVGRDRLATFVGRADYEAAGGEIVADLFTEAVFLQDAALVQELADKKLRTFCDHLVESEGWAWGQSAVEFSYKAFEKHGRIYGKPVEDPERARLQTNLATIQAEYDAREQAIQDGLADPDTGEIDEDTFAAAVENDAELERIASLIEEANAALSNHGREAALLFHPAEKTLAGVAVSLNHDGALDVRRGLVHPDQIAKLREMQERARIRECVVAGREGRGHANDGAVDDERELGRRDCDDDQSVDICADAPSAEDEQAAIDAEVEAELARQRETAAERQRQEAEHAAEMKGDLSAALVGSLTLERTAAIRTNVAMQPGLALRLVVYQCALRCRQWPREHAPVIGIEIKSSGLGSHADSPAGLAYRDMMERVTARLPDDPIRLWEHVMAADDAWLFEILAVGVAGTLDLHIPGPQEVYRGKKQIADRLAQEAGLDMRFTWRADEAFFGRVSKGLMIEALREAAPMIAELPTEQARELALADLARNPKAELVKITAQALEGTGWLPKPLRTPGGGDGSRQTAMGSRDEDADGSATHHPLSEDGADAVASSTGDDMAETGDPIDPSPLTDLPPWMTGGDEERQGEPAKADVGETNSGEAHSGSFEDGASAGTSVKPAKAGKGKPPKIAKPDKKSGKEIGTKMGKAAEVRRKPRHANGAAGAI